MKNSFWAPRVFTPEILEICEFVWSNRIFRKFFLAMAFEDVSSAKALPIK